MMAFEANISVTSIRSDVDVSDVLIYDVGLRLLQDQNYLYSNLPVSLEPLRPQPTRRTSWKLVANPGWQPGFPTSFQLVA